MNKAFFLDRDGVINDYAKRGYVKEFHDFNLNLGVTEALRLIKEHDYMIIIVTNQPNIAKGNLTVEELEAIHGYMMSLFAVAKYDGKSLIKDDYDLIDDIFFCPHHPEKGWPGEIEELKIQCNCRKPQPGMVLEAARKHYIDLSQSWMIGDSDCDEVCALKAKVNFKRVDENNSLLDCVKFIFDRRENYLF